MDIQAKYDNALNSFVEELKQDNHVICIMYGGSLKERFINETSIVDIFVIVVDDKQENLYYTCIHDDIVFDVVVWGRLQIMQNLSNQLGFLERYSGFSTFDVLFSRDDQFVKQFNDVRTMRKETFNAYFMEDASQILNFISQISKHLQLRNDTSYCQYLFIKISECLARMEHMLRNQPIGTDFVVDAKNMNPVTMNYFNTHAIAESWDVEKCNQALKTLNEYLSGHIVDLSKPILLYHPPLTQTMVG